MVPTSRGTGTSSIEKALRNALYFEFGFLALDSLDDLFLGNKWNALALLIGLITATLTALITYVRLRNDSEKIAGFRGQESEDKNEQYNEEV